MPEFQTLLLTSASLWWIDQRFQNGRVPTFTIIRWHSSNTFQNAKCNRHKQYKFHNLIYFYSILKPPKSLPPLHLFSFFKSIKFPFFYSLIYVIWTNDDAYREFLTDNQNCSTIRIRVKLVDKSLFNLCKKLFTERFCCCLK